jgi:hypothetical protein
MEIKYTDTVGELADWVGEWVVSLINDHHDVVSGRNLAVRYLGIKTAFP